METTSGNRSKTTGTFLPGILAILLGFALPAPADDILLVDDDDNSPNVLPIYEEALSDIGLSWIGDYDTWDTTSSSGEPDATTLQNYNTVIWFTGDRYDADTGPASTSALETYLDNGGCFVLVSQDYLWARSHAPHNETIPTAFMRDRLGLASATQDQSISAVTGAAPDASEPAYFYDQGKAYNLDFNQVPMSNFSDSLVRWTTTSHFAYMGNEGVPLAAIYRDASSPAQTHAAFFAYPFEAIASRADRATVMNNLVNYCQRRTDPVADYHVQRLWPPLEEPWYFTASFGLAIDEVEQAVYVASSGHHAIKKFSLGGGYISQWGLQGSALGEFENIYDIALQRDGEQSFIYVSETTPNNRIQKFSAAGELIPWPESGAEPVPFGLSEPRGIDVGVGGYLYVADINYDRIVVFDPKGNYLFRIGDAGTGDALLSSPKDVAVDDQGYIFVLDGNGDEVKKYYPNGTYTGVKWTVSTGGGEFSGPSYRVLAKGDKVYVLGFENSDIRIYSNTGGLEKQLTAGDGTFIAGAMDVASDGTLLLTDAGLGSVRKYDPTGRELSVWGSRDADRHGWFYQLWGIAVAEEQQPDQTFQRKIYATEQGSSFEPINIKKFNEYGTWENQFAHWGEEQEDIITPRDIEADSFYGGVWVADWHHGEIDLFFSDGNHAGSWAIPSGAVLSGGESPTAIAVGPSYGYVLVEDHSFYSDPLPVVLVYWPIPWPGWPQHLELDVVALGAGIGRPQGIAIDPSGDFYITADLGSDHGQVFRFQAFGGYVASWPVYNPGQDSSDPGAIAVDTAGNVFVVDRNTDQILKYANDNSGTLLRVVGERGTGDLTFSGITDIEVAADGSLYVAEHGNARVQVLDPVTTLSKTKAIVVAGGGRYLSNHLWNTTQRMANRAYAALTRRGINKNNILFLSSDQGVDVDKNGILDDIDGDATRANLEDAITGWATDADDVVIYLTDHGGNGRFRLSEKEILNAEGSNSLDSWLGALESRLPATGAITIVYDACEAGSFETLAHGNPKRRFIGSTQAGVPAYFTGQGELSFSNAFWSATQRGEDVEDAYQAAYDLLTNSPGGQTPVFYADQDGNGSNDGITAMHGVYLGTDNPVFGSGPSITNVLLPTIPSGSSAGTITVHASDSDGISQVWAVLYPPFLAAGSPDKPFTGFPIVDLKATAEDGVYIGTYDQFKADGVYQLVISASDGTKRNTTIARHPITNNPMQITVGTPLKRRAIIVAGGDGSDQAGNTAASQAYAALRAQGYPQALIDLFAVAALDGKDGAPDLAALGAAITGIPAGETGDVVLFLAGASDGERFDLNGTTNLPAAELNDWLGTLQGNLPAGRKVTIVMDGDNAGYYLARLHAATAPQDERKDRIRLASTRGGSAHAGDAGNGSFSTFFWGNVANGARLPIAYLIARNAMHAASNNRQQAWLDSDSDNASDKFDLSRVLDYTIGPGILLAGDEPVLGNTWIASTQAQIDTSPMVLELRVQDVTTTGELAASEPVWALVTPPDIDGPTGDDPVPVKVVLIGPDGNGLYQATHPVSDPAGGTYKVSFYARDSEGTVSAPLSATVTRKDGYEASNDDTMPASATLTVDPAVPPQYHSLHSATDVDWVRFTAFNGEPYAVHVDPVDEHADIILTVQGPLDGNGNCPPASCSTTTRDDLPAGHNPLGVEIHTFTASSGDYAVKIELDTAVANTPSDYVLKISNETAPGTSAISGQVHEPDGSPVLLATVTATGTGSAFGFSGPVHGDYAMNCSAGSYQVQAIRNCYLSTTPEPVVVPSGGDKLLNITIIPGPDPDTDGDSICNSTDDDDDGDSVLDPADAFPLDANESADSDGDGTGNNADTDDDNDNLLDTVEAGVCTNGGATCLDPLNADTDGDGLSDGVEIGFCIDPAQNPSPNAFEVGCDIDPFDTDSDNDGLCDGPLAVAGVCAAGEDLNANGVVDAGETNPLSPDSDNDGMADGYETAHALEPLVNDAEADKDGDGYSNIDEYSAGTNPNDPNDMPIRSSIILKIIPHILQP